MYLYGLSLNGWHAIFCITIVRHDVTITPHAIKLHFLIWVTTVRQPKKRLCSCVLTLKYTFICVYWWTRRRIHNTLIVVDRYLRLMGDKAIPDSAEPRLESFYPPFVAGIDLPHQGVVDCVSSGDTAVLRWYKYNGASCNNTSMGLCKKDVTPLLTHWSYVFRALTHRHVYVDNYK